MLDAQPIQFSPPGSAGRLHFPASFAFRRELCLTNKIGAELMDVISRKGNKTYCINIQAHSFLPMDAAGRKDLQSKGPAHKRILDP